MKQGQLENKFHGIQLSRCLSRLARPRAVALLLLSVIALGVLALGPVAAKPPGGGNGNGGGGGGNGGDGQAPRGTIYFFWDHGIWAMNPDGSGKQFVFDIRDSEPGRTPSNLVYPAEGLAVDPLFDRWWLSIEASDNSYDKVIWLDGSEHYDQPQYEVYAYHPKLGRVQVTNLFGKNAIFPKILEEDGIRWSSDGKDSFIVVWGQDVEAAVSTDENGDVVWDYAADGYVDAVAVYKIPVSASEIQTGVTTGSWEPVGSGDLQLAFSRPYGVRYADVSPDGAEAVFTGLSGLTKVLPGDTEEDANDTVIAEGSITNPTWSPDPLASDIVYWGHSSIWRVPSDGSTAPENVLSAKSQWAWFAYPKWSPDAQYLVVQYAYRRWDDPTENDIEIVDLASGKTQLLTGELAPTGKAPLRWVSNDIAQ